jgi:hypothetical protein
MEHEDWKVLEKKLQEEYDLKHKEERLKELDSNYKGKPLLDNLPKTEDDARAVYKFLGE